jgi:hypothetical protein
MRNCLDSPGPRKVTLVSRLSPLDKALVLILVPLYVVCVALARGGAHRGSLT